MELLFLLAYAPLIISAISAMFVAASLFRLTRGQPMRGFAWPAVMGATAPQLAVYLLLFKAGHSASMFGAIYLIWAVAGLFCVMGLVAPPAPARRWMFWTGVGEIVLGGLFLWFISSFRWH